MTPTIVRMSEPSELDPSHSNDTGHASSNPRFRRHSSTQFRRLGTVDSTAITNLGNSKFKPPKLDKNDRTGKWRIAAVFDNWQDNKGDIMKV